MACAAALPGSDSLTGQLVSPSAPAEKGIRQDPPVTPPALREPDEQWVADTLDSMTLDEKIGQMIMPVHSGSASSQLSTYDVGGFVFLASDSASVLSATNSLQAAADTPLLFSIDCEAGAGARVSDATAFPMNMGLAATRETNLARQQGIATARECRALGVQIAFGPVLDVNTEPINPIIGIRSYGDDPGIITDMARAYVEGARSAGLAVTFKHFPGHGATEGDSHDGLPVVNIPCDELQDVHVEPYRQLISEGVGDLVMTAHVWYPCLDPGTDAWPATLSEAALKDILRDDLGFDGVLITDAMNMAGVQIAASNSDAARHAVQAGVDILLMPPSVSDAVQGIQDAITNGQLTEARIDESVRRILRLKSMVGLPEDAQVDPGDRTQTLQHPDHLALAGEIGGRTIESARVDDTVVPIAPDDSVLVIPMDSNTSIFYLFDDSYFTNALSGLRTTTVEPVGTSFSSSRRNQLVNMAGQHDVTVVASYRWKPDEYSSQKALVEDLQQAGVPLVYANFGSPYHLNEYENLENYFCAFSSHYDSQEEMARVLAGDSPARGIWPVKLFDMGTNWELF